MAYWLALFTGRTWHDFQTAGSVVMGFRATQRKIATQIATGDVFVCYLTGVKRWIGTLEVVGPTEDSHPIWRDDDFPIRFQVRPLLQLSPEQGVPMDALRGRVDFYRTPSDSRTFRGFLRRSPGRFVSEADARLVMQLLRRAEKYPEVRPVVGRLLERQPFYKVRERKGAKQLTAVVSVPAAEPDVEEESLPHVAVPTTRHLEMQFRLLTLGSQMGLQLWVATNDRSKDWQGKTLSTIEGVIGELPVQFNRATQRTIELIDVLWLRGNSIVAAFEIESTTSVYSGILRMGDLVALQPNLTLDLYLIAPDERAGKVEQEILRPTFALRENP